jgi:hypothetical protein
MDQTSSWSERAAKFARKSEQAPTAALKELYQTMARRCSDTETLLSELRQDTCPADRYP